MKNLKTQLTVLLLSTVCLLTGANGQLTPSGDTYTNTADPTTNYSAKTLLDVESASQTTYIQFDLSSIPTGYTSANIDKATLKLYVNTVAKAGSLNVDYVNGTWLESTIMSMMIRSLAKHFSMIRGGSGAATTPSSSHLRQARFSRFVTGTKYFAGSTSNWELSS